MQCYIHRYRDQKCYKVTSYSKNSGKIVKYFTANKLIRCITLNLRDISHSTFKVAPAIQRTIKLEMSHHWHVFGLHCFKPCRRLFTYHQSWSTILVERGPFFFGTANVKRPAGDFVFYVENRKVITRSFSQALCSLFEVLNRLFDVFAASKNSNLPASKRNQVV